MNEAESGGHHRWFAGSSGDVPFAGLGDVCSGKLLCGGSLMLSDGNPQRACADCEKRGCPPQRARSAVRGLWAAAQGVADRVVGPEFADHEGVPEPRATAPLVSGAKDVQTFTFLEERSCPCREPVVTPAGGCRRDGAVALCQGKSRSAGTRARAGVA